MRNSKSVKKELVAMYRIDEVMKPLSPDEQRRVLKFIAGLYCIECGRKLYRGKLKESK